MPPSLPWLALKIRWFPIGKAPLPENFDFGTMGTIMKIIKSPAEMQTTADALRSKASPLGLVPTMGAFHDGHISLIKRAAKECAAVVVSIFVNPTQFGPNEDFDFYPRSLDPDLKICKDQNVAAVYAPSAEAMFEKGFDTWVEVPSLAAGLCGANRPGHFRGVATVVAKLISICRPERVYLGEKDYQQLVLIRRMVLDLNLGVNVIGCSTVREKDGLAISSRNANLGENERNRALSISRGLYKAQDLFVAGEREVSEFKKVVRKELEKAKAEINYIEVIDPDTLEQLEVALDSSRMVIAAKVGEIRLIDNLPLKE
ncbi:MAG: pantoate--beta-alanine ligase [Nitrospinota bacterium]|nr:pantoate--beta-alanine ligase [Nitrospinota bacterium]